MSVRIISRVRALLLALALMLGMTVAGAAGTASAAPATATAGATQAAHRTHNCVDNYEWRAFQIGWGKGATEYLFDTRGWTLWSHGNYWKKRYYHCGRYYTYVTVLYLWNGNRYEVHRAHRD